MGRRRQSPGLSAGTSARWWSGKRSGPARFRAARGQRARPRPGTGLGRTQGWARRSWPGMMRQAQQGVKPVRPPPAAGRSQLTSPRRPGRVAPTATLAPSNAATASQQGAIMITEYHTPADEAAWHALRAQDLTSTDIAALFNLSPYKTHFELWHEKKSGEPVRIQQNERMKWGNRLEASVALGIAEDRGWTVRPLKEYGRLPGLRLGSSFDFRVIAKISNSPGYGTNLDPDGVGWTRDDSPDDAILEIKCVDFRAFRDGWTVEDDYIEAPPHIEIQVQH